jgi:hypothetical protein
MPLGTAAAKSVSIFDDESEDRDHEFDRKKLASRGTSCFSRAACYTTRFLTLAAQCPRCCPQRSTKIYSRKSMMLMTCKRKCIRCRQCTSAKPAFAHKPIEQIYGTVARARTHARTNARIHARTHTHACANARTHTRAHTHHCARCNITCQSIAAAATQRRAPALCVSNRALS